GLRVVELAMAHAAARGHALHLAAADDGLAARAVLVLQRAGDQIGDDLHILVRMGGETAAARDHVFVDHAQPAIAHLIRVVEIDEGEAVVRLQPAMIGPAARIGRKYMNGHCSFSFAFIAVQNSLPIARSIDHRPPPRIATTRASRVHISTYSNPPPWAKKP